MDLTYYSGANVWISLGGIPILDAVALAAESVESKSPIYGYSSVFYDAVARGQRIIEGSVVINYIRPNLLYEVLRREAGVFSPTGDILDLRGITISANFGNEYVERIIDVHFRGSGKRMQIDSDVIVESYTFFGRHIIKGVK